MIVQVSILSFQVLQTAHIVLYWQRGTLFLWMKLIPCLRDITGSRCSRTDTVCMAGGTGLQALIIPIRDGAYAAIIAPFQR